MPQTLRCTSRKQTAAPRILVCPSALLWEVVRRWVEPVPWKLEGDYDKAAQIKKDSDALITKPAKANKKAGDITLSEVAHHNKPHDCWTLGRTPWQP